MTYYVGLLDAALERTKDEYGPYELIQSELQMPRKRLVQEMKAGRLTVVLATYKSHWESDAIAVPFPILLGISSYRLFYVTEKTNALSKNITGFEQFKAFRFGQGLGWSSAKILEDAGLTVVYAKMNESLVGMLKQSRFDYYMRGAFEVTQEWSNLAPTNGDILIDQHVAMYTYLPKYFYVPLDKPELATRLEEGLKALFASGDVQRMLAPSIARIESLLQTQRRIFQIENTNLKPGMYQRDKPYLVNIAPVIDK